MIKLKNNLLDLKRYYKTQKFKLKEQIGSFLTINNGLFVISLICIYILFSNFFEFLKLPCCFLEASKVDTFNEVIESLSVGFLTGVFVYYLTVILKNRLERKKRKWELYCFFQELNDIMVFLETNIGEKYETSLSPSWFENNYDSSIDNEIHSKVKKTFEKFDTLKHLLREEECDALYDINTNLIDLRSYEDIMTDMEVDLNCQRLRQICQSVSKLVRQNNKRIQKKPKSKKHETT